MNLFRPYGTLNRGRAIYPAINGWAIVSGKIVLAMLIPCIVSVENSPAL